MMAWKTGSRTIPAAGTSVGGSSSTISLLSESTSTEACGSSGSGGGAAGSGLEVCDGVGARVAELDPPVELLITPEGSMSGYFVEGGVRDVAVTAGTLFRDLATRHEAAGAKRSLDVAVGFYEVFQNRFYNSCLYATLGGPDAGVKHVHRKVFLPTYGVFDEERFVERG